MALWFSIFWLLFDVLKICPLQFVVCLECTAFLATKAKKYYDNTFLALCSCERIGTAGSEGGEQVLIDTGPLGSTKISVIKVAVWGQSTQHSLGFLTLVWQGNLCPPVHKLTLALSFLIFIFFTSYSTLYLFPLLLGEISAAFMEDCGTIHNHRSSSWNIYSDKAVKLNYTGVF